MANFSTHLVGATTAGVVTTSLLAATDLLPVSAVPAGVGLVALGGIFPDVDSDYSDSIDLVFSLLGVALAVPLTVALLPKFGLLVALAGLGLAYVIVRYGVIWPFRELTVHRGVFHSVPMAVVLACLVAGIGQLGMGMNSVGAWVHAGLFTVGFLTHLVLDETYSVDLANRHIKRSFGSALKLFERDRAVRYVGLYVVAAACLVLAPSPGPFFEALGGIEVRLLPDRDQVASFFDDALEVPQNVKSGVEKQVKKRLTKP